MRCPRGWTKEDEAAFRDACHKGTPRVARAQRLVNEITAVLSDFLPQDGDCLMVMQDYLVRSVFRENGAMVRVLQEWDALNEAQLAAAMVAKARMPTIPIGDVPLAKRPVAFRVQRKDGVWELLESEQEAAALASIEGIDYQGLYVREQP